MLTVPETFALALQRHQAGHLAEAEALYRKILAAQPDHSGAWHRLSLLAEGVGRVDLARELRQHATAFRISVAHPTCRPDTALTIRQLWIERAAQPEQIEYLFGINEGDIETVRKLASHPHALSAGVPVGYSSAVANYNAAVAATHGALVICAQDDIYPPPGWDDLIWQRMQPHLHEAKVLHVHDGFSRDQLMVVMCVTRKWLERNDGHVLAPEYDGYFSDTEFSCRAYAAGEVVDGRDIAFYHDHPFFTRRANDETYLRQHNPEAVARGRSIFQRRNPGLNI